MVPSLGVAHRVCNLAVCFPVFPLSFWSCAWITIVSHCLIVFFIFLFCWEPVILWYIILYTDWFFFFFGHLLVLSASVFPSVKSLNTGLIVFGFSMLPWEFKRKLNNFLFIHTYIRINQPDAIDKGVSSASPLTWRTKTTFNYSDICWVAQEYTKAGVSSVFLK